jgi:hypothetical protein
MTHNVLLAGSSPSVTRFFQEESVSAPRQLAGVGLTEELLFSAAWVGASLLLLLLAVLLLWVRTQVGLSEGVTSACFLSLDHLQTTLLFLGLTDVVAQRRALPLCLALLATLPALLYIFGRFTRLLIVLYRQAPGMEGPSSLAEFGPALMLLRSDHLSFHLPQLVRRLRFFSPEFHEFSVIGLQAALVLSGIFEPEWLLLSAACGSSLLLFVYLLVLRPYRNPCLNILVVAKSLFLALGALCSILSNHFYAQALQESSPALEWGISICTIFAITFLVFTMLSKLAFLLFVMKTFTTPSF